MGFLAAPLLFTSLPDRALAGDAARQLFMGVEYLGLICGLLLMMLFRVITGRWLAHLSARLVGIMLVLTVLSLVLIDPWLDRVRLTDGAGSSAFAWAHGLASIVYVLVSLAGVWLVLRNENTDASKED